MTCIPVVVESGEGIERVSITHAADAHVPYVESGEGIERHSEDVL